MALCALELPWNGDFLFTVDDVLDNLDPANPSAISTFVSCSVAFIDLATGAAISGSPLALAQVNAPTGNDWRGSITINAANGFADDMRLRCEYTFNGGAGFLAYRERLALVVASE